MSLETSLLINSAFALRQQDNKPVYTQIGKKIERPYSESDLNELKESLLKQYTKAGLSQEKIKRRLDFYENRMKGKNIKTDGKTNYPIDLSKLERIIITPKSHGYISTAFIDFIKSHNIAIYWIDCKGKIKNNFKVLINAV
ncbi:MAG: hypothetical protein OIN87_10545 [Candidatus Methanoperedens sp.]|nr:hypothetical protein [Candidatus Methanoperedens sp.]